MSVYIYDFDLCLSDRFEFSLLFVKMTTGEKTEGGGAKPKQAIPSPPPLPRFKTSVTVSVTNQEIANFWKKKLMNEEEHLLAAIKAAARIRARKLTDEEYKRFEESLKEDDYSKENNATINNSSKKDENTEELHVGIKDWWTKSKYAYLNQPAIKSMDTPKCQTSTYIPDFCSYKPAPPPTPSFGIV